MVGEERAPAARFDGIASDDLVLAPVGAFHEHVGLHAPDDLGGRVLVEDGDGVDDAQRRENLGAFVFGRNRP